MRETGFPAYTTSAGWLGYSDEKLRRLCREAVALGWSHVKLKVGADIADDLRRALIMREEVGPERKVLLDANQRWEVNEAIANMKVLARSAIPGGLRNQPALTMYLVTRLSQRRSRLLRLQQENMFRIGLSSSN